MRYLLRPLVIGLLLVLVVPLNAEAAYVRHNRKHVSTWEGFQNSANGAVSNVLPWNWFGKKGRVGR